MLHTTIIILEIFRGDIRGCPPPPPPQLCINRPAWYLLSILLQFDSALCVVHNPLNYLEEQSEYLVQQLE